MSVEFFPTHLTSPLTEYLHKFLGHSARTRGLVCWYIVLCWEWSIGLICSVCLFLDNICHRPALIALLCSHYGCADFLRTYCGESDMSANPGIVPLQDRLLTEVSLPGLSYIVLVVQICYVRYSGQAVVGFLWDHIGPVYVLGILVE